MKLNTFEIVGVAASIGVMALALWFVRLETTNTTVALLDQQSAAVVVADGDNQRANLADALSEASNGSVVERLVIDDVRLGTGDPVEEGDTVVVHYVGTLQNGIEFDNSYTRGDTFSFKVGAGRVIAGWEQGILGMQVGGQRILVIPSSLGYGAAGGGPIPPNSTLVFAIELIEIE